MAPSFDYKNFNIEEENKTSLGLKEVASAAFDSYGILVQTFYLSLVHTAHTY